MANGDVVLPRTAGQTLIKLLDATSGAVADNGQWVDCGEYDLAAIVVQGAATTTTVEVDASNDLAVPANNTHGAPVATKTAAGLPAFVAVTCCPRWLKARIVDTGTGAVTALALLRSNAQS